MSKRILVIDDSVTVREHVALTLAGAGYEVLQAADGAEGLEAIGRHGDLAMVLCDVNMPRMSGIELVEELRRRAVLPALPVLMLTTEAAPSLVDRAKKAGAKGWIVKPFKPDLLLGAVRKLTG